MNVYVCKKLPGVISLSGSTTQLHHSDEGQTPNFEHSTTSLEVDIGSPETMTVSPSASPLNPSCMEGMFCMLM